MGTSQSQRPHMVGFTFDPLEAFPKGIPDFEMNPHVLIKLCKG